MRTIRSGKIARLPEAIRKQLNERLANHESSTPLLAWLNALPEVQTLITREFGGKIIVRQNLHEWRHGGHAEWRRQQEVRRVMEWLHSEGAEVEMAAGLNGGSATEFMTTWLATRYVVGMKQLKGRKGDRALAWDQLRECCHDIVALRREEHLAQRLEFDRERLCSRPPLDKAITGLTPGLAGGIPEPPAVDWEALAAAMPAFRATENKKTVNENI